MFRKPFLVLMLSAAATGLVAAGCGSSSSHTTPAANASAGSTTGGTSPTGATGATGATGSSGSSSSGSSSSDPAVAQAVTACKASINSASQLSASLKTKLTGLCDKAAHGDSAGVKKVAAEVCKQIVNADVPSSAPSSIKDQALAACKKA